MAGKQIDPRIVEMNRNVEKAARLALEARIAELEVRVQKLEEENSKLRETVAGISENMRFVVYSGGEE